MTAWTDPETGMTIVQHRRTTETVTVRAIPEIGDVTLAHLRLLVERTAHLSPDALVYGLKGMEKIGIDGVEAQDISYHSCASEATDEAVDAMLSEVAS